MRKSKDEAAQTRKRIVKAAASEFRRNGVDGTGLATLMAAAGLTHGGFYKHFGSKEQIIEESLVFAAEEMNEGIDNKLKKIPGIKGLNAVVKDYLSTSHRDRVAEGCPFAALSCELLRSGEAVRAAATNSLLNLIDLLSNQFEDLSPAEAKKEALKMLSAMIGAMTLARLVNDGDLSASILRACRSQLIR